MNEIPHPELYFPEKFDEELSQLGELKIDAPSLPEEKGQSRDEILRGYQNYFSAIANVSDEIPLRAHKVRLKDKSLSKAQDNLLVGLHLLVEDLVRPGKDLILDEHNSSELQKCAKELELMPQEMRLLSIDLSTEEISPFQIDQKLQERKQEQVHSLNAILIKIIQILQKEIRRIN